MPIKREKPAQDLKPSRRKKVADNNLLIVIHSSTSGSKSKSTGLIFEVTDEIKHSIINKIMNNGNK
jgi:hypothetical protein